MKFSRAIKGAIYLLVIVASYSASSAESFSDAVKGLTKKTGFYSLYGSNDKSAVLLEVDKLNQPFIYVSSLIQGVGSNDLGLDRGQIGESRLVQFEKIGQRVILRQLNPYYRAISDNPYEVAALNLAFTDSVLFSFEITAQQKERLLIDITDFAINDLHGVGARIKQRDEGSYRINTSTSLADWAQSKAFTRNTEISALVTFNGQPSGQFLRQVAPDARYISVQFRHSLVALPESGYQMRAFEPDSGYFPFSFADYSQPIAKPLIQRYIYRHRLSRDSAGKIVKPIVYYLDPGVPEPVRSALLDGARWWSTAFDKAGLAGGFSVEMLPEGADPLDVSYNVIQWVHRATRGWSYGSSVSDPRTGEILKGHVTLGSLRVKQDYLIAAGLLAGQPQAKISADAQAMALARIRQLAAHEVGHTLGLAHNFASSVNDRSSVMDYPHPLVTLKDQAIDLSDAYGVGVGSWDDYAINFGYGTHTPTQRHQLVVDTLASGLKFMSDRDARAVGSANPWAHLWDNGNKADQELTRLMLVREVALNNLDASILNQSQAHSELREAIVPIYLLHRFQVAAASKIIAGIDYNYALAEQKLLNQVVSATWQRQALQAVLTTLSNDYLTLPQALLSRLPPKAFGFSATRESFSSQTGFSVDPLSMAEASARHTLRYLLDSTRANRLMLQVANDEDQLSLDEMLTELIGYTLTKSQQDSRSGLELLISQRVNTVVVEQLLALSHRSALSVEAKAIVSQRLDTLTQWLKKKAKRGNKAHRIHSEWLQHELTKGRNDPDYRLIPSPAKLPPGSPI